MMTGNDTVNQQAALVIREAVDNQTHSLVLRECHKVAEHMTDEDEFCRLVTESASVADIVACLQTICERTGGAPHGSVDYDKWLRIDSLLRIITVQRNHHTEALVWNSAGS